MNERFQPFTHTPGHYFLIPSSTLVCRLFPSRIEIYDYQGIDPVLLKVIEFSWGPLKQFTAQCDLDKGYIQVGGFTEDLRVIRYRIFATNEGWALRPIKGMELHLSVCAEMKQIRPFERLHLGSYKKQRFAEMAMRLDMTELLGLWYAFGQLVDPMLPTAKTGTSLLGHLERAIASKGDVLQALKNLFRAGFRSVFVPRLFDDEYHGFSEPIVSDSNTSPLVLLQQVAPLIRSLFFKEDAWQFSFLEQLPSEFHSGSLSQVTTTAGHSIAFCWSKHQIRTIHLHPHCDDEIQVVFQKEIRRARVRQNKKDRGRTIENGARITLTRAEPLLLDQFEK